MNVLIATHGRPELLERTLRSLVAAATLSEVGKVVVVENGGAFGAEGICKKFENILPVLFESIAEANKSVALNAGLEMCDSDLIFLTDDDVEIPRGLLRTYQTAGEKSKSGVFYGGPTKAQFEVTPEPWLRTLLPLSARGSEDASDSVSPGLFIGFNWAAYKEDLMKAGGFNPSFGPGSTTGATGQESEMQRRLMAIGCRGEFIVNAVVSHYVPVERCSKDWLIKRAFRQGVEKGLILKDRPLDDVRRRLRELAARSRLRAVKTFLYRTQKQQFKHQYYKNTLRGMREALKLIESNRIPDPPFI